MSTKTKSKTTTKVKTINNTTASKAKDNVPDIEFWGDGDLWLLISKASSVREGWMKSTKALEIKGAGCFVQVTTQQGDEIAEAVAFAPSVIIVEDLHEGKVVSRRLVTAKR